MQTKDTRKRPCWLICANTPITRCYKNLFSRIVSREIPCKKKIAEITACQSRRARTNFKDSNSAPPQRVSWSLLRLAWLQDATSSEEVCQHTDLAIFDWEDYLQYKKEKNSFPRGVQNLQNHEGVFFEALEFTHLQETITI